MEGKLNYEVAEGHRKEINQSSTTLFPLTFRNEISLKEMDYQQLNEKKLY